MFGFETSELNNVGSNPGIPIPMGTGVGTFNLNQLSWIFKLKIQVEIISRNSIVDDKWNLRKKLIFNLKEIFNLKFQDEFHFQLEIQHRSKI